MPTSSKAITETPFARAVYNELCCGPPGLWVEVSGADQPRAVEIIAEVCRDRGFPFYRWSPSLGLVASTNGVELPSLATANNPANTFLTVEKVIQLFQLFCSVTKQEMETAANDRPLVVVFLIEMADRIVREDSPPQLLDAISKLMDFGPGVGVSPIFLSKKAKYPTDFLTRMVPVTWLPMNQEETINVIRTIATMEGDLDESEDSLQNIYSACRGMSVDFVKTTAARSLRFRNKIDPSFLSQAKAETVASQLGVEIRKPRFKFSDIGGLAGAKDQVIGSLRLARMAERIIREADKDEPDAAHLEKVCAEFTRGREEWAPTVEDAIGLARKMKEYPPRGVLLYGVAGSGKSMFTEGVAGEMEMPLLVLRVTDFLNKFVGASEENFHKVLMLAEHISPCGLQIDEVEKMFAGANNPNGSGVEAHIKGQYLSWLQDHRSEVYVMMTCNDIQIFIDSPELIRSGRCDATYFFDVPTSAELTQIWEIYRAKFGVPAGYKTPKSVGWTGANIVDCCRRALEAGITLEEAAKFVRPPDTNPGSTLEKQRDIAVSQNFLAAAYPGFYTGPESGRSAKRSPASGRSEHRN